jgi:hypothetical protein
LHYLPPDVLNVVLSIDDEMAIPFSISEDENALSIDRDYRNAEMTQVNDR